MPPPTGRARGPSLNYAYVVHQLSRYSSISERAVWFQLAPLDKPTDPGFAPGCAGIPGVKGTDRDHKGVKGVKGRKGSRGRLSARVFPIAPNAPAWDAPLRLAYTKRHLTLKASETAEVRTSVSSSIHSWIPYLIHRYYSSSRAHR